MKLTAKILNKEEIFQVVKFWKEDKIMKPLDYYLMHLNKHALLENQYR